MSRRYWIALGAIAAAIPLHAVAEQAVTVRDTEVYAGPSSEYPSFAHLPANASVDVAGCLSDWSWCDVTFSSDRGWVYGADIAAVYEGQPVVIIESGPRLHLPVVAFSLVSYWDQHYRSKPFYGERQQWVSRVHIAGGHGGKAPAGHERVAQRPGEVQGGASARSSTNAQIQQGQAEQQPQGAQPPSQRTGAATAGTERSSRSATMRGENATEADKGGTARSRSQGAAGMTESRPPTDAQQQPGQRSAQSRPSPEQSVQREQRPQAQSSRSEMESQRSSKSESGANASEQAPKGRAEGRENESPKREGEQQ